MNGSAPAGPGGWNNGGHNVTTGRVVAACLLGIVIGAVGLLWLIARAMVTPEEDYTEVQIDTYTPKEA